MSYFSRNQNAKLFMGASTSTPLPAFLSDSYTEVPLLGAIKPATRSLSSAFFNILNDALRRSLGGKQQDKVWSGNVVVDDDSPEHNTMMDDADIAGGRKRNWYLVYPNGRLIYWAGFVSNWDETQLEASEDPEAFRADFSIAQDGGDLVVRP